MTKLYRRASGWKFYLPAPSEEFQRKQGRLADRHTGEVLGSSRSLYRGAVELQPPRKREAKRACR